MCVFLALAGWDSFCLATVVQASFAHDPHVIFFCFCFGCMLCVGQQELKVSGVGGKKDASGIANMARELTQAKVYLNQLMGVSYSPAEGEREGKEGERSVCARGEERGEGGAETVCLHAHTHTCMCVVVCRRTKTFGQRTLGCWLRISSCCSSTRRCRPTTPLSTSSSSSSASIATERVRFQAAAAALWERCCLHARLPPSHTQKRVHADRQTDKQTNRQR